MKLHVESDDAWLVLARVPEVNILRYGDEPQAHCIRQHAARAPSRIRFDGFNPLNLLLVHARVGSKLALRDSKRNADEVDEPREVDTGTLTRIE